MPTFWPHIISELGGVKGYFQSYCIETVCVRVFNLIKPEHTLILGYLLRKGNKNFPWTVNCSPDAMVVFGVKIVLYFCSCNFLLQRYNSRVFFFALFPIK